MTAPVIIVGAGPAGLACLSVLHRRGIDCPVVLCDQRETHLDQTRLHDAWRGDRSVATPLKDIARRYDAGFELGCANLSEDALRQADATREVVIGDKARPFTALVIASGSVPQPKAPQHARDLTDLRDRPEVNIPEGETLEIVGGGASAVQYAAQIAPMRTVRLVTSGTRILESLPEPAAEYAHNVLVKKGVEVVCNRQVTKPSVTGSLWLAGLQRSPNLTANPFGQVRVGTTRFLNIFGAGDCCEFEGPGLNALSAQAAIRKGKLVGRNILRQRQDRFLLSYDYAERGVIVSLGDDDAVGWLGSRKAIVTGAAAVAAKATVDEQYQLLLRGIDTFV